MRTITNAFVLVAVVFSISACKNDHCIYLDEEEYKMAFDVLMEKENYHKGLEQVIYDSLDSCDNALKKTREYKSSDAVKAKAKEIEEAKIELGELVLAKIRSAMLAKKSPEEKLEKDKLFEKIFYALVKKCPGEKMAAVMLELGLKTYDFGPIGFFPPNMKFGPAGSGHTKRMGD